ncbi:AhpC/TSA family protein [Drepanopeziza brunnea f. sp. 'multigermtubi' MB_m1]|uniref:AhpC/TSA family protein n=1 Tax=Marssonina brunnea f. sp. multigermtubi (strain MB_m1) TaxID=1072389 RepID=K1XB15_MARBU|nr:AhpC/TSA family protein [Drepanopeziza brunnea f. sp. 'multigermtubi' MB_m1]EKD17923.1 AhpC/TSA family protein [Drepanopeziza brunnea f. sp. 'multigermtubi' MB_m1]
MVKVGDSIPSIPLVEGLPDNKIDLASELASGSGIIIGVPAAFSPTCTDSHIPGFIAHPKLKSAGKVFVVSVNDSFVMAAWGKSLDKDASSGIRFLGDPSGEFTRALDVEFAAAPLLGTNRSKRYAMVVEGGKVKSISVEPDNTGATVSTAEKILG